MSRLTERELKRRLTTPPAEPPEGLLEKLAADIPRELVPPHPSDRPREGSRAPVAASRWYRPGSVVWRVAAVVVLAAGAGWLASRMGRELPAPESPPPKLERDERLAEEVRPAPTSPRSASREAPRPEAAPFVPEGPDQEGPDQEAPGWGSPEAERRLAEAGRPAATGAESPAPAPSVSIDLPSAAIGAAAAEKASRQEEAAAGVTGEVSENEIRVAENPPRPIEARRGGPPPEAAPPTPVYGVRAAADSAVPASGEEDALRVRALAEDGSALPGAVIELVEGANRHVGFTDQNGATVFREVPPGRYRVEARLEGFRSRSRELEKERGTSATVDVELPLAAVAETIVVEGPAREAAPSGSGRRGVSGRASKVRPASMPAPPAAAEALGPPATVAERQAAGAAPPLFVSTAEDRFSTFGLTVGTGSYDLVRRWLEQGELPPAAAVRLEEMVNAFDYRDEPPLQGDFALTVEGAPSLYGAPGRQLLRLGFTARRLPDGGIESLAKDARVQVEFNPETVVEYRLLGYEDLPAAGETFRREEDLEAGGVETGDALTVLYEVRLRPGLEAASELARVRLRWWSVEAGWMQAIELPVRAADVASSWRKAPHGLRLAALVAELAEVLRGSPVPPRRDLTALAAHSRRLVVEEGAADPQVLDLAELIERAAAVERKEGFLVPRR